MRSVLQALRSDAGKAMVLGDNFFIEQILPKAGPPEISHCMLRCTLCSRTSPDEPNQNQESANEDKQLEE